MIILVNSDRIKKFNYTSNGKNKRSGIISGIEWNLISKKQLPNGLFSYIIIMIENGIISPEWHIISNKDNNEKVADHYINIYEMTWTKKIKSE